MGVTFCQLSASKIIKWVISTQKNCDPVIFVALGHGAVLHQVCFPGKVQAKDKHKPESSEIDSSSVVTCYISECYSSDLKQSPETHI